MNNQIESTTSSRDLLVDFPSQRIHSVKHDIEQCTPSYHAFPKPAPESKTKRPRLVRFSPTSQLALINYPSKEENALKWDSRKDRALFRTEFASDRYVMARTLATQPMESATHEMIYKCLGLESVLSLEVAERVFEQRRRHVMAILIEQARQYAQCAWDDELLSRVSEESTRWSRERAHQVADKYWHVLKEE